MKIMRNTSGQMKRAWPMIVGAIVILVVFIAILIYLSTMIPRGPTSAAVWGILLFMYGYFLFGYVILKGQDKKVAMWSSALLAILVALVELIPLQALQDYLGDPRMAIILLYVIVTMAVLIFKGAKKLVVHEDTQKVFDKRIGGVVRDVIRSKDPAFSEDTKKHCQEGLDDCVDSLETLKRELRDRGSIPYIYLGLGEADTIRVGSGPGEAPEMDTAVGQAGLAKATKTIHSTQNVLPILVKSEATGEKQRRHFKDKVLLAITMVCNYIDDIKPVAVRLRKGVGRETAIRNMYGLYRRLPDTLENAKEQVRSIKRELVRVIDGLISDASEKNKDDLELWKGDIIGLIEGLERDLDPASRGALRATLESRIANATYLGTVIKAKSKEESVIKEKLKELVPGGGEAERFRNLVLGIYAEAGGGTTRRATGTGTPATA